MSDYNRKQVLYERIQHLREDMGINDSHYPINAIDLCIDKECAIVKEVSFKTIGLKGMSCFANEDEGKDIILLNSNLSIEEQKFTCGHELVHLILHRNAKVQSFSCFEKTMPNQNPFLEWQANEGSAEFHVPYLLLLEEIKKSYPTLLSWHDFYSFKSKLAKKYKVAEAVINFRFESLKYEINQYLNGVKLADINIMSASKQIKKGINVTSLNDMEAKLLSIESEKFKIIHDRILDFSQINIYNDIQKNPPLSAATEKDGHYQQG